MTSPETPLTGADGRGGDSGGLGGLLRRAPVHVAPDAPVRDALRRMADERVGAVIVADPVSRAPLGILTHRDVLERVTLVSGSLSEPVASVMTGGVVSLPLSANVHQVRLVLARNDIRHLVVVDGQGGLAGVVSRGDLYSAKRLAAEDLVEAIQSAADAGSLKAASLRIRELAGALVDQGVGAERISEWIAILNDLVVLAALDIAESEFDLPMVRWCWLAFGSEGRLEQTLDTDQDNGLIFLADDEAHTEVLRERFLPFAQRVNSLLDDCGFELCKGGIMAGNPQWCLSLDEWRARFSEWMLSANPAALLNATIFFDFRPLAGDWSLAAGLKRWLLSSAESNELFLRFMAANALQSGPPLGRIRDFVVDKTSGMLDLKRDGSRPFVDAARIYSLALGFDETSTSGRLRAASVRLNWSRKEADALVSAFHFIQQLRLGRQRIAGAPPNLIAPDDLNELERAVLKESFRQARKLQSRLQVRYQL